MKLRIQDDSLRLRLTRNEVARLREQGFVECSIRFPLGPALVYSVVSSSDADIMSVRYEGDTIRVTIPLTAVTDWAESDQVTLQGSDANVYILVEKDFQCLHGPGKIDPEGFPNPLAT